MKRRWLLGIMALLALPCMAQQIMYASLKELMEGRGDTVSTLKVEKRAKNQIYLMGGADYRITADENPGLSRYLRSRCYAVRIDTALYVNCRKMRYKRYRFGQWYASAMWIGGKIYFSAQPLGQAATSSVTPVDATKLGGEVGDAIAASGLVYDRVYYELDPQTGKASFVGKDKMTELLKGYPELQEALLKEKSERAEVIGKYLRHLDFKPEYSTASAQALINLTKEAKKGKLPTDQQWEALFATDGYKQFFNRSSGKGLKDVLRTSYEIAFDPSRRNAKDSILNVPVREMKNDMDIVRRFCVSNFVQLGDSLEALEACLANPGFSAIFAKGNRKSLKYLPSEFMTRRPDHHTFYLILFYPEAWSINGNVYMDFNFVYNQGEESFVNLIGHEMHHSYRRGYMREKYRSSDNPLTDALDMMQSEGCADQVNKHDPPYTLEDVGMFGEEIVKMMNERHNETPAILRKIDSLTVAYLRGTIDRKAYGQVAYLPTSGGHSNGFYMTTLIKRQLGLQAVIDCSVNPVKFIETYNKAARKAGDEYVFTDEFVGYVRALYRKLEK